VKVISPVLEYEPTCSSFVDRNDELRICREDANFVFKMKKSRAYRLLVYTSKPKGRSYKFKFNADTEHFRRKGEAFELYSNTMEWLLSSFGLSDESAADILSFDGRKLWVKVKEV
jgi:hypothetical protein